MVDFMAAVNESGDTLIIGGGELVGVNPFDASQVPALFKKFHSEIDGIQADAESVIVTDDQTYASAQEIVGLARKLKSTIDKKRKDLKAPYLAFTKVLDGEANGLSSRLDSIARTIESNKMLPYAQKKEVERREAERKAREEAAKRQAELDRKAKEEADRLAAEAKAKAETEGKDGDEAARVAAAMAEPAPVVVPDIPKETKLTTDSATSKVDREWKWDVVSFADIPVEIWEERREHVVKALAPALNARVKAGLRDIHGVKIYQVEKLNVRARR